MNLNDKIIIICKHANTAPWKNIVFSSSFVLTIMMEEKKGLSSNVKPMEGPPKDFLWRTSLQSSELGSWDSICLDQAVVKGSSIANSLKELLHGIHIRFSENTKLSDHVNHLFFLLLIILNGLCYGHLRDS